MVITASTYMQECLVELAVRSSEANIHLDDLHSVDLISAGLAQVGGIGVKHHATVTGRTLHNCILAHTQNVTTKVLHL